MSPNTPLDANEDFARSINFFGEIGYVLKLPKTVFHAPAVIVFSNNTIAHTLDVTLIVYVNDASQYIEAHFEEAKDSKHIIVFPITDETVSFEQAMELIKCKYNRMLEQLFKMYDLDSLASEANKADSSFSQKFRKFISSIFVTFGHGVIQPRFGE